MLCENSVFPAGLKSRACASMELSRVMHVHHHKWKLCLANNTPEPLSRWSQENGSVGASLAQLVFLVLVHTWSPWQSSFSSAVSLMPHAVTR
jgi:hypothetical protein